MHIVLDTGAPPKRKLISHFFKLESMDLCLMLRRHYNYTPNNYGLAVPEQDSIPNKAFLKHRLFRWEMPGYIMI